MEILVLGDSLPFGRPKYGICRDQTWPYLLSKELGYGLQMRAKGGATITDVVYEAEALNSYWFKGLEARKFDVTFVQVGIVDCCPRLLPKRFYGYASRMPGFGRLSRNPFAHRILARPWVSEKCFIERISFLDKILCSISKLHYFIEIAEPANHLIDNVGDFSENVRHYNKLICKFAGSDSLIQWQNEKTDSIYLLPDGHHLTMMGHRAVATACLNIYKATF